MTDSEWGLVGIALGLFVGFAVRKGSGGRGGWRYQALAMALTYLSITASHVPIRRPMGARYHSERKCTRVRMLFPPCSSPQPAATAMVAASNHEPPDGLRDYSKHGAGTPSIRKTSWS